MKNISPLTDQLTFQPVTKTHWKDFETLFGKSGACGGCWCMWWRTKRADFEMQKGDANKRAMNKWIASGNIPGILAYHQNQPIGWCSIAPREEFVLLERSRILKRVDDKPVWSIVCFFISKQFRHQGLSVQLIKEAVQHAASKGALIIESYPVDPKKDNFPDVFAYVGTVRAFIKSGFVEVARRSETRPIMRYGNL